MAGSRKRKNVKQNRTPDEKQATRRCSPEEYYGSRPAWSFASADQEKWTLSQEHAGDLIWTEILPRLKLLESQTWSEILIKGKKKNHQISPESLNKVARKRMEEQNMEIEGLISLTLSGKHRLYGFMDKNVFAVIWYDDNHGDNATCVCRSHLKNT